MPETLKEKTAKGLFWGGLSSTVQQLLGIVFGIILARRLNQSDFGMIAMITIFQLIGNDLQNSGFKVALVNLRQPTDRDYNSVFWFNILMGGSLYVLLFFLAPFIADFYHIPSLTPLARYAFLSIVFASFGTAQSAWLFKNLHAKQQAKAGMMAVLISSSVAVAMAHMGFAYWALATQTNLYILLCTLLYWHYSPWRPTIRSSKSNVQNPSDDSIALSTPLNPSQPLSTEPQVLSQPHRRCLSTFIDVLRPALRMFRFSVKLLISQVLTDINNNVLNILLGRFYGRHDTGNYNQAFQWSTKGSNIIQSMVQQVAQPVLVSIDNEHERQLHVLRKMMRFAAFLSFPLLFGLSLVSHEFIVTLLGEKWAQSAHYLRLLAVASAFLPLSTLLANGHLPDNDYAHHLPLPNLPSPKGGGGCRLPIHHGPCLCCTHYPLVLHLGLLRTATGWLSLHHAPARCITLPPNCRCCNAYYRFYHISYPRPWGGVGGGPPPHSHPPRRPTLLRPHASLPRSDSQRVSAVPET